MRSCPARSIGVGLLAALSCGALPSSPACGATRIELRLDEARADRNVAWPVTTGVPFPQGGLVEAGQCRLVDDRGEEQPLQSRVAATWDAAGTSIRWLTIDFVARPGRRYALEFGPDVRRRAFPSPLAVTKGAATVVDTGKLRVDFSARGPSALQTVRADLDGDGRIADAEVVARGPDDGDHAFVDANGTRSSNSRDGADRTVVVEADGPVRGTIRVDGWYTAPDGKRIVRHRTRYHLFAGLQLVKVVDQFRIVGSTRDVKFSDIALPLRVELDRTSRRTTVAWDAAEGVALDVPWTESTRAVSLAQETFRHYGNPECRAAVVEQTADGEVQRKTGERAGGWMQIRDGRVAVTGSLRWFAEQFPKEWEATGDRLVLHLWSPRGGPLDFGEAGLREFFGPAGRKYLLEWDAGRAARTPIENFFYHAGRHALERDGADGLGIDKHHEAWFHFAPAGQAEAGRTYGALAQRPPLCLATGEWNVGTGVFGPLAARPNESPYEAIVDRIFGLERGAQDEFGDYGWWLFGAGPHYSYQWDAEVQRHYADPRRFEYHTYQRETQLWWCYLRSGERRFLDWALPSENHWVDVAVSHVPTKYSTQWRGGERGEAELHFAAGDWSIDSPLHYVRHHDTGEAWLRSAPQFWATYHRTLETTTLAYYLTGDERFADVVDLWRAYWGPLAGVRSDSRDVLPWHREQLWFAPTEPGAPTKSWAEMLRDYAPFQSGSRHQMTLLFNLATLYEHTWDPTIGRVLREYADAFLSSESPNGTWQCQDHRLPANADSPMLAHYWAPALWKYARASQDPRMPEVLRKYFTACRDADPYGEDVGIYSNNQIAWAWHFTRDPRHLVAARNELEDLLPFAEPLARPEDLGQRIYNPYAPIKTLAAVPRLIGALHEAERLGVQVPPEPPLAPQRALIALARRPGTALRVVTWGWDRDVQPLDAEGKPTGTVVRTETLRSHRQPYDRDLPGFQVFRATIEAPAADREAWCCLSPRLETGLLELAGVDAVWCWAGEPLTIAPRRAFRWTRTGADTELVLATSDPGALRVTHAGRTLDGKSAKGTLTVALGDLPADARLLIESTAAKDVWFRIARTEPAACWVSVAKPILGSAPDRNGPAPPSSLAARRSRPAIDSAQTFVPGRFGEGLLIVPGRELHIPDEIVGEDGVAKRLSDAGQGTIEFRIRRLSDGGMPAGGPLPVLDNGPLQGFSPWKLPVDDWAHVAVVWRTIDALPDRPLVHVYVDGRDHASYRSLFWEGYSPPPRFASREWRREFVVRAPPGVRFVLDDLRISNVPRYCDPTLSFGRQQTFNSFAFDPPDRPAEADSATVLHFAFDGQTTGTALGGRPIEAKLVLERR